MFGIARAAHVGEVQAEAGLDALLFEPFESGPEIRAAPSVDFDAIGQVERAVDEPAVGRATAIPGGIVIASVTAIGSGLLTVRISLITSVRRLCGVAGILSLPLFQ